MISSLLSPKRIIILSLITALVVLLWFWRGEIYRAAENACAAAIGQKTIEVNEQSRKDADAVKIEEQSRSKRDVIDGLRDLSILRPSEGGSGQ